MSFMKCAAILLVAMHIVATCLYYINLPTQAKVAPGLLWVF